MQFNTPALLEAFFERSQDGFFFMMLDEPIEWGPTVDKDAVLDYVFAHQHMTKVNPAMAQQFRATPERNIDGSILPIPASSSSPTSFDTSRASLSRVVRDRYGSGCSSARADCFPTAP